MFKPIPLIFNSMETVTNSFAPEQLKSFSKLPVRDIRIHSADFERIFDDNALLAAAGCSYYKICSVRVHIDQSKYLCGLQFTYLNLETRHKIEGHAAYVRERPSKMR